MKDRALKDYFLFDDTDLTANRNGTLSGMQKKNLADTEKGGNKIMIGMVVMFFAIAAAYPLLARKIDAGSIIWMVLWGGVGCYTLYSLLFSKSVALSKIKVESVKGPVHFVAMNRSSGGEIVYNLRIGKKRLDVVDHTALEIMAEGDVFIAYFYNRKDRTGSHILSLEWVSKGEKESIS